MERGDLKMRVSCCKDCVAPKRYPGCHDHCPERAEEVAGKTEQAEARRKAHMLASNINNQKIEGIRRAMRRHGRR